MTDLIKDQKLLTDFKADLVADADIMAEQRDQANEDMRFVDVQGGMWEGFLTDKLGKRVKLEVDLVSDSINEFKGEWNQNRLGVEFKADDLKSSDEDADLINGIYRADHNDMSGKIAIDTAVDETAKCGYGAFKLGTVFVDDGDPENDLQRVEFRPKHTAFNTVFWDRAAKRIDKRDARHCTEIEEYTTVSFQDAFPDHKPVSAYEPDSRRYFNYNSTDQVFVATRYQVVKKKEKVFIYNNFSTNEVEVYNQADHDKVKDELQADDLRQFVRERKITVQYVEKYVFNGEGFIEKKKRIAGKWIPIIPMYGFRGYVDGVEWYRGLVNKLKDLSRLLNMQLSRLAENSASAPQDIPFFDPDQMPPNIAQHWEDTNNKSYLPVKALRENGKILQAGPLGYLKPQQLDASTMALLEMVPVLIQTLTGGAPQDTLDPNISGKAINAIQKRMNLKTQPIQDNIANSIRWAGEVYQAMAADVYTTSRIMTTIGKDGKEGKQQLLKTVLDKETGKLIEANSLNGKKFRVTADIGPQYESLREQTVEDLKGMMELLSKTPSGEKYTPIIMTTMLENIQGVGLDALKKMVRHDMLLQGFTKPETDEEKAFVAQAQQPKDDQDKELKTAITQQQLAEAGNLQASSAEKIANAALKKAQTRKILSDIQVNEIKTLADIRKQVFQNVRRLPVSTQGVGV